jgi:hypothetical protein
MCADAEMELYDGQLRGLLRHLGPRWNPLHGSDDNNVYAFHTGVNCTCGAGSYLSSTPIISCASLSASCMPCDVGFYCPYSREYGFTSQVPCIAGFFCNSSAMAAPIPCPEGTYNSASRASACTSCPAGRSSLVVGASDSSVCNCCPIGTFANTSGLSHCLSCFNSSGCSQTCTIIPDCSCRDRVNCDINGCPRGCYTRNDSVECSRAPAGHYTECSTNCSDSPNALESCPKGTSSPSLGASSNSTCKQCPGGTFCPSQGMSEPMPRPPHLLVQHSARPVRRAYFQANFVQFHAAVALLACAV